MLIHITLSRKLFALTPTQTFIKIYVMKNCHIITSREEVQKFYASYANILVFYLFTKNSISRNRTNKSQFHFHSFLFSRGRELFQETHIRKIFSCHHFVVANYRFLFHGNHSSQVFRCRTHIN